jgi:hypothetical protein
MLLSVSPFFTLWYLAAALWDLPPLVLFLAVDATSGASLSEVGL